MRYFLRVFTFMGWVLAPAGVLVTASAFVPLEAAESKTTASAGSDPIAELERKIAAGREMLTFEAEGQGFLKSLLAYLDIQPESQMLVFSKTSLQHTLISPKTPRAIYFNEQAAVGYVQNADVLEIIVPTREQGYAFYTLENRAADRPYLIKHEGAMCGRCHGADSLDPGLFVASTPTAEDGTPVFVPMDGPPRLFNFTDQTTPFADRWNGWYVTGDEGMPAHLGNGAVVYGVDGLPQPKNTAVQSVKGLSGFFDVSRYLAPSSDIVALMTFEHQARMTNLLLAAGVAVRRTQNFPTHQLEEVVAYLLFADEVQLEAPISGDGAFVAAFSHQTPRTPDGRSLRDFDLQTRLFKYPCSYMIYSPAFDALPVQAKQDIYKRLVEILSGRDMSARYAHLTNADRKNILDILLMTKPDFAALVSSL